MSVLSFVTFKWKPVTGYRSTFGPETVNVLASMLRRNYTKPSRVICVTDDPAGIDSSVEIVPLWNDYASVPSPHGGRNPSCYRRLKLFARDAGETFGERIVSIDLDCVITGNIEPLFAGNEDFRMAGDTAKRTPYNGSLMMLRTGAHPDVWEAFNPTTSPQKGRRLGYVGSDQAWIGAALGPNRPKWTRADGVYSFRNQIAPPNGNGQLPQDAKVILFHGHRDPWGPGMGQRFPWIAAHYK